jgi:parallel beta-helix repeat protein
VEGDPSVRGHAQLCGVFVAGEYSYENGPKGPKPKGVIVRDCILQHFFGRAVAFYSVEASTVERCSIMDINDEAIDFDHFATGCIARGNTLIRCRVAFELNDASNCTVEGNEVRSCGLGVNVWRWCKLPGLNEGNVIRNNLFKEIAGNGVQMGRETTRNVIEGNEMDQIARNGISLSGDAQVVRGNVIRGVKLKDIALNEGKHQIEPAPAAR